MEIPEGRESLYLKTASGEVEDWEWAGKGIRKREKKRNGNRERKE
jgi:hypothetical protein